MSENKPSQHVIEAMQAAVLSAARSQLGSDRELEAWYNNETGRVDLFVCMKAVKGVEDPKREISLDELEKRKLEAEPGEWLMFQIFWHPADAAQADRMGSEFRDLLGLDGTKWEFSAAVEAARASLK